MVNLALTNNNLWRCYLLTGLLLINFLLINTKGYAKSEKLVQAPLRIAVAANFAPALTVLLEGFTKKTGIDYQIISAATGVLYQQIRQGAPFDVFLSADSIRPQLLEQENLIVNNSRKTYAYGQIALWSSKVSISHFHLTNLHLHNDFFAIANPELAPYGKAAKQALEKLAVWQIIQNKLIVGININQTFQQLRTQVVSLGVVSLSQLKINNLQGVVIPDNYYQPIEQQLVLLKNSKMMSKAKSVINYLLSDTCQQKLANLGYKHYRYQPLINNKMKILNGELTQVVTL